MLFRAYVLIARLTPPTPWRVLTGAIAAIVLAQSARAETVVYECKVSQSTVAGVKRIYSDTDRERPELRERFAFNVPKGRGCVIKEGACDATLGRLYVEQDESTITAKGADPPLILSYGFVRKAFYLLIGEDSRFSDRNDCREIELTVIMP